MVGKRARRITAAGAALAVMPVLAAPVDQVNVRQAGFKALGAAFKSVNDAVRAGSTPAPLMQDAGNKLAIAARDQYRWFPAGSGPQPGTKTAARPDIWAKPRDFKAAQDNFTQQVIIFRKIAGSGDPAVIRAATLKIGAACKNCHDNFRVADD